MNIENNIPEYTVSEFNNALSDTINRAFDFIKIRGEISNLKFHQSGHIYFNLKDESSIINIVCPFCTLSPTLTKESDPGSGCK